MNPIDPKPLVSPGVRQELKWVLTPRFAFARRPIISELRFEDVLRYRRSERSLQGASLTEVCSVFSAATTSSFVKESDKLLRSRRPSIASGALHPIEIFFLRSSRSANIFHFGSSTSMVSVAKASRPECLKELWREAENVLPDAVSTLVVLLGRPAVLQAAYSNPQSLLWRDSGALLQTLSMVACSIGLGFCPLGILGSQLLEALPRASEPLEAVGAAWLGRIK